MVEDLTNGRVTRKMEVHLDPDLRPNSVKRPAFQSALGQCGQSQFHLFKQGVDQKTAKGDVDLFLFFGLYRRVSNDCGVWKYQKVLICM